MVNEWQKYLYAKFDSLMSKFTSNIVLHSHLMIASYFHLFPSILIIVKIHFDHRQYHKIVRSVKLWELMIPFIPGLAIIAIEGMAHMSQ